MGDEFLEDSCSLTDNPGKVVVSYMQSIYLSRNGYTNCGLNGRYAVQREYGEVYRKVTSTTVLLGSLKVENLSK